MPYSNGTRLVVEGVGELEIKKNLNIGAFAESYEVLKDGKPFFFKKYTDPSVLFTPWYKAYKDYQDQVIQALSRNELDEYIVNVLNIFEYDDFYCQLHEWAPYKDLSKFKGKLDGEKKKKLSIKFLRGLEKIHEAGVIHSDLKPENILVKDEGDELFPLICDFDWSVLAGKPHPWEGGYRGTPFYYSYEHMYGGRLDYKSDIFTAGIILYEIHTGVNPLKFVLKKGDYTIGELGKALKPFLEKKDGIPKPREIDNRCGLNNRSNELIRACLSSSRNERPSLEDLIKSLSLDGSKVYLALIGKNGIEIRTREEDVERRMNFLGRERCRMFDNYHSISRFHGWLLPNKSGTKWFIKVPSREGAVNFLTVEKMGKPERKIENEYIELETGDVIRVRDTEDPRKVVIELKVELRVT